LLQEGCGRNSGPKSIYLIAETGCRYHGTGGSGQPPRPGGGGAFQTVVQDNGAKGGGIFIRNGPSDETSVDNPGDGILVSRPELCQKLPRNAFWNGQQMVLPGNGDQHSFVDFWDGSPDVIGPTSFHPNWRLPKNGRADCAIEGESGGPETRSISDFSCAVHHGPQARRAG